MAKYIFGERNDIHIIDLQKSVRELKKAYKFMKDTVVSGKKVLFVGTKKQAQLIVQGEAERAGTPYISTRWLGGTLTNFDTIRKSINRLHELESMKTEGIMDLLSKKERGKREKERSKLEEALCGIKNMNSLPGAIFIVDPVEEHVAVHEGRKLKIPIVSICDTDSDPDLIDYPIPGNDDAVRSIKLFTSIMADAIISGKEEIDKVNSDNKSEQPVIEDNVDVNDDLKSSAVNAEQPI